MLKLRKVCVRFFLTSEQKGIRVEKAIQLLAKYSNADHMRLREIATGDETWLYFFEPDCKESNKVWVCENGFFSLFSNVFINFRAYANLHIWTLDKSPMSQHSVCTKFKSLDELLLRYEYFCRDIPILKKHIMRFHGNHAISHSSNEFIL